jgi:hypothetical protein
MRRLLLIGLLLIVLQGGAAQAQGPLIPFDTLPDCGFGVDSGIPGLVIGAVVYNFETGSGCVQNLDRIFPVASIPKLFISVAYERLAYQGLISPDETVRFDERYYMAGDTDCLGQNDIGRDVSLRELNEIMIWCSDNAATWMLMDRIGWDAVENYVNGTGYGEAIGEVLPYAFVDRYKLAYLDTGWLEVPAGMASRFYRDRQTEDLDAYLDYTPGFQRGDYYAMNQFYFDNYSYNTATPRALAGWFADVRDDYLNDFDMNGIVAGNLFANLLETQRLYSSQAFPGTVYVGAKNGFDTGLVAEINYTISDLAGWNRTPSTVAVIFTHQTDLTAGVIQNPRQNSGVLNRFLWELSPQIVDVLFPAYQRPTTANVWSLNTIRFSTREAVDNCWVPYWESGFDPLTVLTFESCLGQTPQRESYRVGEDMALGLVLRGLGFEDTRLTFVYTQPDGVQRSYQTQAPTEDQAGVNWYHPLSQPGEWQLEIYVNLELGYTGSFQVN